MMKANWSNETFSEREREREGVGGERMNLGVDSGR